MIAWQGRAHEYWCPECCTEFVYKEKFQAGARTMEYPAICAKCGERLIVRSSPIAFGMFGFGMAICFLAAVAFSLMGSEAPVLAVLSTSGFILLVVLSIFLRRFQVLPAVVAETKAGKGPLLDPGRDPISYMIAGLGRVLGARRGPLDSIGRWCVIVGFLVSTACFAFNSYPTVSSLVAWLVELAGLGVLLRKNESFIVVAGAASCFRWLPCC